ncbi:MAG: hypothetical protein PHC83_01735 [Bacteroidales bacterium]|nr:hypothetical protein [Bacteroidales bacterium]MDD4209617.1 hypothetical protein [Bacteroidales bacterium]
MKIKKIIILIVVVLTVISTLIANAILSKDRKFNKIIYHIEYPSEMLFAEKELDAFVKDTCGKLVGKFVKDLDLNEIEKKIACYPFLKSVEVIANTRGHIIIKAVQHKIIVRVFNAYNESFYISETGTMIPMSKLTGDRILIANGSIYEHYRPNFEIETHKNSTLYSIWKVSQYIEKDAFWKAQIAQIYINLHQQIELGPTIGNHTIEFGNINAMDEKFKNLKYIYTKGFKITGWDKFATINLKFGNQIPCKKR